MERSGRTWVASGAALVALPAVLAFAAALRLPQPLIAPEAARLTPAVILHLPLAEPLTATTGDGRVIEATLALSLTGPSQEALAPLADAMRFADPALIAALGEALRVAAGEGSADSARAALPQAARAAFLSAHPAPEGVTAEMLVTAFSHRPGP